MVGRHVGGGGPGGLIRDGLKWLYEATHGFEKVAGLALLRGCSSAWAGVKNQGNQQRGGQRDGGENDGRAA